MSAWYNENDKYAAQWLRNLISKGLIADGEVDERSIVDVRPEDLRGFTQCHFFAGIGGWSYALRLAGWEDTRPVWTGSCPCQPFSAAGKQKGFADERHLWPVWAKLIAECKPSIVFGEQVAAASKWLVLVRSDLEEMGYAVGAMPIQAASAGADHLRDRYWFVADGTESPEWRRGIHGPGESVAAPSGRQTSEESIGGSIDRSGVALGDAYESGSQGRTAVPERAGERIVGAASGAAAASAGPLSGAQQGIHSGEEGRGSRDGQLERRGGAYGLADADLAREGEGRQQRSGKFGGAGGDSETCGRSDLAVAESRRGNGPVLSSKREEIPSSVQSGTGIEWVIGASIAEREPHHESDALADRGETRTISGGPGDHVASSTLEDADGFDAQRGQGQGQIGVRTTETGEGPDDNSSRSDAPGIEWVIGADGKARRVKSGIRLLAHGVPARVSKLRAFGNAIDPRPAAAFIGASMAAMTHNHFVENIGE